MKNTKSTKRALLISVMSLLICCTMLVGTTYAWFTDSVTSTGNIIKTGTLEVSLEYSADLPEAVDGKIEEAAEWTDASTGAIFYHDNWEPGYTQVRYVKVENEGSLDLKFMLTIVPNAKADKVDLADVIDVYLAKEVVEVDRDLTGLTLVGTLADLIADPDGAAYGVLYADDADKAGKTFEAYTIVLKMQETAGNEYQNISLGGGFSVNLLATQLASESDDLDENYDAEATYPVVGAGSVTLGTPDLVTNTYTLKLVTANDDGAMYKGTIEFDAGSAADGAKAVTAVITAADPNGNIDVQDGETVVTYNIDVEGLDPNNTTPVKVWLFVGEGLNITKLVHHAANGDEELAIIDYVNGQILFETDTFSPFSIVVSDKPVEEPSDDETPKATVTANGALAAPEWNSICNGTEWNGLPLVEQTQSLDATYTFEAPHTEETVKDSIYKDWYCDFFVSVDQDVAAGDIILAGNYVGFDWIGFKSPVDVDANYFIPLLSQMGHPWTYGAVVREANPFLCGVSDVGGKLAAAGVTFTVELRLINPDMVNVNNDGTDGSGIWWENMTEGVHYIVANKVVYTFGAQQ